MQPGRAGYLLPSEVRSIFTPVLVSIVSSTVVQLVSSRYITTQSVLVWSTSQWRGAAHEARNVGIVGNAWQGRIELRIFRARIRGVRKSLVRHGNDRGAAPLRNH